jgi:hypothetical protein
VTDDGLGHATRKRRDEEVLDMRRFATVAVLAVTMLLLSATAAWADAPKFHSVSSSVNSSGALVVNWDERGLGNLNIDYTLTADASAVFACINGGGNHPQAANKETVNSEVSASGSFEPRNGRITASLTAGPPSAGGFTCPGGQRLVLASVSYTNIVLTDTSNGVSASLADASRTFFTF